VSNRKDTAVLSSPPAPPAVCEQSFAEVRVLAGRLSEKVVYPLPLYRQPHRLPPAGIGRSRGTLPRWGQRAAALVAPIYYARLSAMRQRWRLVRAETPLKAGRREQGNLQKGIKSTGSCKQVRQQTQHFCEMVVELWVLKYSLPVRPT
jgi:transposase